jgi:hypothetical protein
MSQDARDLRHAGLYLFAIAVLGGGLVLVGTLLAQRANADAVFAETTFTLESTQERAPTRLSVAVENAREIRAALAKPNRPLTPLPPITAKLAYGHLKSGSRVAQRPLKLPKKAMDAMASAGAQVNMRASYSASAPVELHQVY